MKKKIRKPRKSYVSKNGKVLTFYVRNTDIDYIDSFIKDNEIKSRGDFLVKLLANFRKELPQSFPQFIG